MLHYSTSTARNGVYAVEHSSLAIANEFIFRGQTEARTRYLTNMQLQKLVYLAHGWHLAVEGEPLLNDHIEAWQFGPVIRRLYDAIKKWGRNPINDLILWGDDTDFDFDDRNIAKADLSEQSKAVIDKVWKEYGDLKAFQLSALTHAAGTPWEQSFEPYQNVVISNDVIRKHFVELAARA